MARIKPGGIERLKDLKDVDDALFKIANLRVDLKRIDADTEEKINAIKKEQAERAEPLLAKVKHIETSIFAFAEYNRAGLFKRKKTIELSFGLIGYRKSTKVSIKKTTLTKLKEMGFFDGIRIKESVDKEKLAEWSEDRLALVDAKKRTEDKFWCEIKEEAITEINRKSK